MALLSCGLARSGDKQKLCISTAIVLMGTKLGRMVLYLEAVVSIKSFNTLITWSCNSRDKQKPLYLYCQSAYDYQSWQGNDLT